MSQLNITIRYLSTVPFFFKIRLKFLIQPNVKVSDCYWRSYLICNLYQDDYPFGAYLWAAPGHPSVDTAYSYLHFRFKLLELYLSEIKLFRDRWPFSSMALYPVHSLADYLAEIWQRHYTVKRNLYWFQNLPSLPCSKVFIFGFLRTEICRTIGAQ